MDDDQPVGTDSRDPQHGADPDGSPGPDDGSHSAADQAPSADGAPEGVARADELAETLVVARESGDGSLLLRTLARAMVFVPLPAQLAREQPGRQTLEPGSELPLPLIENEGTSYVVAFTSEQRMLDWFPQGDRPTWHETLLADLLQGWPDRAGLALDASSEGGVLLPEAVIERLKLLVEGAPIEEAFDLGPATRFRAGTPIEPPAEVIAVLRGVAAQHPTVQRVTLLLVQIDEPGGRTWPVVGVLCEPGADPEPALAALVAAVEEVTEEHVSFTSLPETGGSEFEQVLRDSGLEIT
ncbi:MAG: SseB protein N-terminal domain [Frankiaceae bacterium]|nr:SseB protein N-terminal domain [Frankiaceae bacterium]